MGRFKRIIILTLVESLIVLMTACVQTGTEQSKVQEPGKDAEPPVTLTVSAAASLKDARLI